MFNFILVLAAFFAQNLSATLYEQSTTQFQTQINDSNSAVALMLPVMHILPGSNGTFHLETFLMENTWNICQSEPLAKAPPLVTACTGFLIAPDILVTAGHCMVTSGIVRDTKNSQCEAFSFVFGYHYEDIENKKLAPITGQQIAHCKKVIYAAHLTEPDNKTGNLNFGKDVAIVQLDRKMPFKPFNLVEKSISEKDFAPSQISMQGHPFGMPLAESKGVTLKHKGSYLLSAINSFPANSGSAVKDKSDEVIGLLVRGYPDSLIENQAHKCSVHNRCDTKAEKCTQNDPLEIAGEHILLLDKTELSAIIR